MLLAGGSAHAEGADSRVEVMVCPTADQVHLSITQPTSDSVVSESKLAISGMTNFVSQVDIYVDTAYNNTIALSYADTSFTSDVSLRPGTNTVKIVATGTCGVTTAEESVIITYQPKVQASVGGDVPTIVDDQVSPPAVVSESIPEKSPILQNIDRWVVAPLINIGKSLDIITLPSATNEAKLQNTSRSVFFVLGSGLTLTAAYLGLIGMIPPKPSFLPYTRGQLIGGFAITGLVMLVLVFIL